MVLSAPPTALWVVPVADLGGVARHVLDVARVGLPGYRLVVMCPAGPLAVRLREAGAAVLVDEIGPAAGLPRSLRALRRVIKTLRPAVVHTHLSYADIVGALATVGTDTRLVTTEHGIAADDLVYHGSPAKARVMSWAHAGRLRQADAVIAVAQATAEAMRSKWQPKQSIVVILNGVDRPSSSVPQHEGLRILSLARLSAEKRIAELIKAFAILHAEDSTATLTIAGDGPLRADLETLVAESGLGEAVSFVGHVDASAALADADVLAQLSVWENCSYSLLDGMTHGLGVVASPVGGNPELLPQRCLVDPEDAGQVAAMLREQGRNLSKRPTLPAEWPTVAVMADSIAGVYGGIR